MDQIKNALALAFKHHEGQYRKYGDQVPYVQHVIRVSLTISNRGGDEVDICAALLHDTKEDTNITDEEIISIGHNGELVLWTVKELTNPSKEHKGKPRSVRKQIDREHLKHVSLRSKKIKLADRYDNLLDLKKAPKDFRVLYATESLDLLNVALRGVDPVLEKNVEDAIKDLMSTTQ